MTLNNTIPIDEIISEVYRVKEQISSEHDNDIHSILESLRQQQSELEERAETPNKVSDLIPSLKSNLGAA